MVENGESNEKSPSEHIPDRVKFDYIKSNFFRVVHADGVVGGVTPALDIHMDVWSQRAAIPRQIVHEMKPDGTLGEEIREERTVRDAIVREVEVGLVLNREMAEALIDWLREKINQVEETRKKLAVEPEGDQ